MKTKNIQINNKPKAVLFDWDGTLANTLSAVVEALEYVLKKYNKEPWQITREKYRDRNKSFKENFPNFFGDDAWKAYQEYLDYYVSNTFKKVVPNKGAADLLLFLQEQGIDLYIVSNKEKSLLLEEVKTCYPNIKFKNILGNGDAARNKPAPDPIFFALKDAEFDINDNNVWFVGDSSQDVDSAAAAGVFPVVVGKISFINEDNIKDKRIVFLDDFPDLLNYVIKNFY